MGKRQRARERRVVGQFVSPLLQEYAKAILDEGAEVDFQQLAKARQKAAEVAAELAAANPPVQATPEEIETRKQLDMLATAVQHANRCEFALGVEVWSRKNGKGARVIEIKFADGWPVYKLQRHDATRVTLAHDEIEEHWSKRRVHFPVDLETGRFILPAA